jgi:hypothetical protein
MIWSLSPPICVKQTMGALANTADRCWPSTASCPEDLVLHPLMRSIVASTVSPASLDLASDRGRSWRAITAVVRCCRPWFVRTRSHPTLHNRQADSPPTHRYLQRHSFRQMSFRRRFRNCQQNHPNGTIRCRNSLPTETNANKFGTELRPSQCSHASDKHFCFGGQQDMNNNCLGLTSSGSNTGSVDSLTKKKKKAKAKNKIKNRSCETTHDHCKLSHSYLDHCLVCNKRINENLHCTLTDNLFVSNSAKDSVSLASVDNGLVENRRVQSQIELLSHCTSCAVGLNANSLPHLDRARPEHVKLRATRGLTSCNTCSNLLDSNCPARAIPFDFCSDWTSATSVADADLLPLRVPPAATAAAHWTTTVLPIPRTSSSQLLQTALTTSPTVTTTESTLAAANRTSRFPSKLFKSHRFSYTAAMTQQQPDFVVDSSGRHASISCNHRKHLRCHLKSLRTESNLYSATDIGNALRFECSTSANCTSSNNCLSHNPLIDLNSSESNTSVDSPSFKLKLNFANWKKRPKISSDRYDA